MDILDDMGVSKLSAKVFSKVNYSFKLGEKSIDVDLDGNKHLSYSCSKTKAATSELSGGGDVTVPGAGLCVSSAKHSPLLSED